MLLAATCGIHFIILQFRRKQDKYPLLELISFYIVYFFRILWLPSAILMFILFFNLTEVYIIVPFVLVTIGSIANGISHYHQYVKVYRNTMANLKKKHENSDFRVSAAEGLVIAAGGVELQDLSKDHLGKPGDRQTTRHVLNEYLNKIHEQHEDMAREKKEEEDEELKRQARAMKGMSAASQLPPPPQQHQQQKFSSRISDLFNDSDDEND
jgi:signal transduction histidine kinase